MPDNLDVTFIAPNNDDGIITSVRAEFCHQTELQNANRLCQDATGNMEFEYVIVYESEKCIWGIS